MVIGHHKKDRDPIPGGAAGEQAFKDAITRLNIGPGEYGFPDFCQHDNLPRAERTAAQKALYGSRPMGLLRVWGEMNMGANIGLTLLFYLVTSAAIGYLAWAALPHGVTGGAASGAAASGIGRATFAKVFQITGTAGILAYCFASFPNDLWFQKKRRAILTGWIDGVVFGLITGAIFASLWPR